ncbi:MAG: DNA polymerase III subunit delta [Dehalococcoidia bacterium]|nr:DNA polymerase III subunit delta [Dehalococcoidia bacterium]
MASDVAPVSIIYGPDEFRAAEALAEVKATLNIDGMLETNTSVLAGRGLTPEQLIQHAAAVPFLATARLVVVEGLITAAGGRKGAADSWQAFLNFAPQMPETSHVVFVEPASGDRRASVGGSALFKALAALPGATVTQCAKLKTWGGRGAPSEVEVWLAGRARDLGIQVERGTLAALVDLGGADLRMLAGELVKLRTYAGDRPVTADDVALLTPQVREESVFAIVDAAVEGKAAPALRLLRKALDDETEGPGYYQFMIARQVRHLVRATSLMQAGAPPAAIGEATGLRGGFPLDKLVRQARSMSAATAEAALREVEATDHAVKTGALADELALELLVVRLSELAAQRQPARR